ncbi:MAG: glutamate synthase [Candidatus Aminicenantes bacterium]|nr:MAG: glutamate synthase [Candidatus Aminicenantes bacterium]
MDYDALVIGGGIAGMESALNLGDMGYRVLLVEKEASIGGKMILLSKVFPTLDCASCIATPKMAATAHHPNITLLSSTQVEKISPLPQGSFKVRLHKKATFVDAAKCTGCQECEFNCPVAAPDQFNYGLVARRAAYIPFPQAVPKKAIIEKIGTSPCTYNCPASIKAHGYIALARSGKFEEAFHLIMEDAPLVGTLGRACYAPCENECTRNLLTEPHHLKLVERYNKEYFYLAREIKEGPLSIRRIKRFIADYYYARHPEPEYGPPPPEKRIDKKIAIIGSGPAGLTAAYFLAQKGYEVTIYEAEDQPGGMLRFAIPAFRLPNEVVDRDIKNITALGVSIKTKHRVQKLAELKAQGYDAVFLATGAQEPRHLKVEGEDLEGVVTSMDFLKDINLGRRQIDLSGKTVMVVGGGNVAIDSARVAVRLGAKRVFIQYRRSREQMPAFDWEIKEAEEEGVEFQYLRVPVKFLGEQGKVTAAESIRMKLGAPDASGRPRPVPIKGSEHKIPVDFVILAIGLTPTTHPFKDELELNKDGSVKVDPETLQTSLPYVFAGGDAVTGPSMIVSAMGQGKQAAQAIETYLSGTNLKDFHRTKPAPAVPREKVLKRQKYHTRLAPVPRREIPPAERINSFQEVELPLTEEEVRYAASRCLDCGICSECHQCVRVCPAEAIDFSQRDEWPEIETGSIILATGFNLFPAELKETYGYGRFPNVITSMQMDRLLSPTRPYNTVLRPSDGKTPDNIAYILCTGSRDRTVDNPICSQVCCMYSIKQAQLLMGALPLADITIYYIDIRAFGKGFEEFYQQAQAMGTYFVKGKVAKIEEKGDGQLIVRYEDIDHGGVVREAEHDLVILSVGFLANTEAQRYFPDNSLQLDDFHYIQQVEEDISPGKTSLEGVFVAGTAASPMDIPDSVIHAGAAATQAAVYIEKIRRRT